MLIIKYDIVGSFLRPAPIKEARAKYAAGEITLPELRQVEDVEIAKLVEKEVAHGLKYVTDGERSPMIPPGPMQRSRPTTFCGRRPPNIPASSPRSASPAPT